MNRFQARYFFVGIMGIIGVAGFLTWREVSLVHQFIEREIEAVQDIPTEDDKEREVQAPSILQVIPSKPEVIPETPDAKLLSVQGNRIVDSAGKQIVLRGVNIENWNWVWDSSRSIQFERSAIPQATKKPPEGWGANLIVLAIASGPVNREQQEYLAFLDELVALSKANGAYTLLAYRSEEPNGEQPEMPDQAAQEALAKLSRRYAKEPSVLYGLQVEPHNVFWSKLKPRFISMIDAIRAAHPKALIAVPGTQWSRYVYQALLDPILRDNLIYNVHPYDPWETVSLEYRLSEVAALYPVLLGEFGAGSQMDLADVKKLLDFADTQQISWAAWLFHEKGCPCLLQDVSSFIPTPYGEEIQKYLP